MHVSWVTRSNVAEKKAELGELAVQAVRFGSKADTATFRLIAPALDFHADPL
jgi:hypothetical protein